MRFRMLPMPFLALALAAAGSPASTQVPDAGVERHAMEEARISGATVIRRLGQEAEVEVLATVSADGRVLATRPGRVNGAAGATDVAAAEAAVRAWMFRPFEFRGRPATVVGTVAVGFLPATRPPHPRARFPAAPLRDVRIVLERGACFGNCPVYRVEIRGDGTVLFASPFWDREAADASRQVGNPTGIVAGGPHRDRIPAPVVAGLVQRFLDADFFGLDPSYRAQVTDSPTYVLSIRVGAAAKRVEDYIGDHVGMPPSVTALEDAVDAAAGTGRWIKGNAATADALAAEGLDFTSPRAQRIAFYAVIDGDDAVLPGLLRHGLPLAAPASALAQPGRALGAVLLERAIRRRRGALALLLAGRGWLGKLTKAELSSSFAQGAGGCDPSLPARLVAAGADPAARDADGQTALMSAVYAASVFEPREARAALAMIKPLIDAGVPLEAVDKEGRTALFQAGTYETVKLLLAAGARAAVVDRDGHSPALDNWDDRAVVLLLEAGASPIGRGGDGKTLRRRAVDFAMPATLAWLDAHQVR